MMIANRLVLFLMVILTNYVCQQLAPLVGKKMPNVTTRVCYLASIIGAAYFISGTLFFAVMHLQLVYGNVVVTNLVTAALIALIVTGGVLAIVPGKKRYLTDHLIKTTFICVPILTLATVTQFPYHQYMLHLATAAGMYLLFAFALSGVRTRVEIAAIPKLLQGLPLDIVTLFLFYLSFSFLNGVFFNYLF
ncbi:hypothetical protein [Enterococcus sp.]|uniref:hypothetical protein n=1 Tax=Enterococcus sp. TaxID=35783 RepID=UPI0028AF0AED|nr:hypothetical protein [Enterococcus sp.]